MSKAVKTPRFYVDIPSFLHAIGQLGWDDIKGGSELLYMNPSSPYTFREEETSFADMELSPFVIGNSDDNTPKTSFPVNFCALLNHNLASITTTFNVLGSYQFGSSESTELYPNSTGEILNANHNAEALDPQYNGTTIFEFPSKDEYWTSFEIYFPDAYNNYTHQLGSFVLGKYFDCPHSPDLSLTMSRRFDGIKKQKTIGGKIIPTIYYDGPTQWEINRPDGVAYGNYKYPPFELDLNAGINETNFNQKSKSSLGRKGLRSWKLTFSYISESDMWIDNEVSNKVTNDSIDDGENPTGGSDPNPMLSDDSFNFVWNCTLGGTLPFIFQPDKTNNNSDQFSICTFRSNTLSVKQVAYNTYSLSVTIDEVA